MPENIDHIFNNTYETDQGRKINSEIIKIDFLLSAPRYEQMPVELQNKILEILKKGTHVNFSYKELSPKWQPAGFAISAVDSTSKYSKNFSNCLGLVYSGIDKESKLPISFLSHQNPEYFLDPTHKDVFEKELCSTLETLIERANPGTINGGYFAGNKLSRTTTDKSVYDEAVKQLTNTIRNHGLPCEALGPFNTTAIATEAFFNTATNELTLINPRSN